MGSCGSESLNLPMEAVPLSLSEAFLGRLLRHFGVVGSAPFSRSILRTFLLEEHSSRRGVTINEGLPFGLQWAGADEGV